MPGDSPLAAPVLAYVLEDAPVLALTLDAGTRVRAANAHACHILGGEVIGRALQELVVDFTPLPDLLASGNAVQLLTLKTAVGLPESYRFRFFALPDGTLALGSLDVLEQEHLRTEVLGLNRELNDLTRQLHQANAELRELNRLKNEFLGMAAHDLRQPVGVVMAYSEFVLDEAGGQLSPQHQEYLRTCLEAATRMKQLIDDFLDVSIIESGKLHLNLASTSVRKVFAGIEPMARLLAARKKVMLLVDSPEDARSLRVDASKLQQVLLNLLGNAVEHSKAGQRVWLSSGFDDQDIVFAVRDEGSGISPEDQTKLFTSFSRASTRKTAGERSVGLGLAIARLIVEAHGGQIGVESTAGQGCTFHFALPIHARPPLERS